MALETLRNLKVVSNHPILNLVFRKAMYDEVNPSGERQDGVDFSKESFEDYINRLKVNHFIVVDDDTNTISFKIQQGPIKEKGLNGCQLTDLVVVANHMVTELSKNHPCAENDLTTMYWEKGLQAQADRTKDRETRNVEGTSAH